MDLGSLDGCSKCPSIHTCMDATEKRAIELNQQPYKNTLKNAKLSKNAGIRLVCRGEVVVWAIELNYSTFKLRAKNQ